MKRNLEEDQACVDHSSGKRSIRTHLHDHRSRLIVHQPGISDLHRIDRPDERGTEENLWSGATVGNDLLDSFSHDLFRQ